MTPKQLSALTLYYVGGLSFRQVGEVLGVTGTCARDLVMRGRATAIRDLARVAPEDAEAELRKMFAQPERHAAAVRQNAMLDAIEERINKRDADLAEVEDCMMGEVRQGSHHALNTWDQFELTLINEHGWASMQSTWYESKKLTARFVMDAAT